MTTADRIAGRYQPSSVSANPHYIHIENAYVPWTPLTKPVRECKVALITMGGLHLPSQAPFGDENNRGDPSFRELPRTLKTGEYGIAHSHYSHASVDQDINVLLPLDIFGELERDGIIGSLAQTHYSFMGSLPNPIPLIADTAPDVASRLKRDAVDICVLAPA